MSHRAGPAYGAVVSGRANIITPAAFPVYLAYRQRGLRGPKPVRSDPKPAQGKPPQGGFPIALAFCRGDAVAAQRAAGAKMTETQHALLRIGGERGDGYFFHAAHETRFAADRQGPIAVGDEACRARPNGRSACIWRAKQASWQKAWDVMAAQQKILLVEDDDALAELLAEQLALHDEFVLTRAETAAALETSADDKFDLILLDVGLPDQDGRETCKIMRKNQITAPIIMLTGASSEADVILGLDSGANDYVTKPFKFGVLLARMRAHLRSHEMSETAELTIGPYLFKPMVKLLETAQGEKIRLTEKETNILKFLHRAKGAPVAREKLLDEVWGYNAQVSTHTLETHIYRLRRKIETDPGDAQLLRTADGGYCLSLD